MTKNIEFDIKILSKTTMRVQVDDNLAIEVCFDITDREDGYEDDIRFSINETGPKEFRMFRADTTSFLLTAEQAEQLAQALMQAAQASRRIPR